MEEKLQAISLLDVIGPVMIGPSSSHTAGAAKVGYTGYELLGEVPKKIVITLYNSFSDTGKGHKTHIALLGGALGIYPWDEKLIEAIKIAKESGIDYSVSWGNHSKSLHPNTAIVRLYSSNKEVVVVGFSIGGGRIELPYMEKGQIGRIPSTLSEIKPFLSQGNKKNKVKEIYETYLEISKKCITSKDFLDYALKTESKRTDLKEEVILSEFERRWKVMVASIHKGIENTSRADNRLFGGDGDKILHSKFDVVGNLIRQGMAYATAVAEYNGRMGKIVAAPTAGSCGIIPGVFYPLFKRFDFEEKEMAKALVIAASLGAIIAAKMELAGAVGGCQAEIGAAGAMAAGGGCFLLGGNIKQIESAASLVLANLLGLTCDPIMGLVQVPCILRNTMVTSMVFGAIDSALSGVKYPIPFDEVVDVAKGAGQSMCPCYKETSLGGLAQSPTAKRICEFYNELEE
jgi:L-serine dehydratase